jgi:hypothetical protein
MRPPSAPPGDRAALGPGTLRTRGLPLAGRVERTPDRSGDLDPPCEAEDFLSPAPFWICGRIVPDSGRAPASNHHDPGPREVRNSSPSPSFSGVIRHWVETWPCYPGSSGAFYTRKPPSKLGEPLSWHPALRRSRDAEHDPRPAPFRWTPRVWGCGSSPPPRARLPVLTAPIRR